jgi:hypothetical protein
MKDGTSEEGEGVLERVITAGSGHNEKTGLRSRMCRGKERQRKARRCRNGRTYRPWPRCLPPSRSFAFQSKPRPIEVTPQLFPTLTAR